MRRAQRWLLGAFVAGLAAFSGVAADDWFHGPLYGSDTVLNDAVSRGQADGFPAHAIGAWLTLIGDWRTCTVALGVTAAWMLAKRQPVLVAWLVGIGVAASLLLWGLKDLFQRPRPPLVDNLTHGYSFPSGHTFGATAVLGATIILGTEVHRRTRRTPHRLSTSALWRTTLAAWAVLAFLTGAGRVLVQRHWLTDVVASWSLGLAACSGILLALSRKSRGGDPGPQDPPEGPKPAGKEPAAGADG